jgi:hypothetical protein
MISKHLPIADCRLSIDLLYRALDTGSDPSFLGISRASIEKEYLLA